MAKDNFQAASSALYHIEAIERKLKMLKQLINPQTGTTSDSQVMCGLAIGVEDEISSLREDLVRLM